MAKIKRKLIIDGQIFQTDAKDRGMGRYSGYFIQNLLAYKNNYSEVEIVFTKNISLSSKAKGQLEDYFAVASICWLDLKTAKNTKLEAALNHNEGVLSSFINKDLSRGHEVDFLIPALFQEPIAAVFPHNAKKLLLFYDLIPYLYYGRYQVAMGPGFENYLRRFKYIFEADRIFTISQTVADDLSLYLGVPKSKLVRIDGAAIISKTKPVKPQFQVPEKFILMPTSDDPRKNNLRAVLGFEEFRSLPGNEEFRLVITSKISKAEKEHLNRFSSGLVFVGNQSESQLDWLYQNCRSVLFVPEYEGLGLPILEAVETGKPVVCSSISVFQEISETGFFYCDYENPTSIADALVVAVKSKPNKSLYRSIISRYSWTETIARFLKGAEFQKELTKSGKRLRVAVFTPTPNGYSAVGKIVAESHYVLCQHFDVDYYIEKGLYDASTRPDYLKFVAPTFPAESFSVSRYQTYDAVIYHIGNGDYHIESIKNSLYLPGYAIQHDTNIGEAIRVMVEIGAMQTERADLETALDDLDKVKQQRGLTSLVNGQLGLLTHSDYASNSLLNVLENKVPIIRANLPVAVAENNAVKNYTQPQIGLAGIIADIKGLELMEEIALDPNFSYCQFRIFGFSHIPKGTLDRLNNYENVTAIAGLSDFEFQNNLSRLDIILNYRLGYNGETSLSTIEAMRNGVVVIVRDIGWYSELPDDVVIKAKDQAEVKLRLKQILGDKKKLSEMGLRAKKYIDENFGHEQYAKALEELFLSAKEGNSNDAIARALKSGGIKTSSQLVKLTRARFRE